MKLKKRKKYLPLSQPTIEKEEINAVKKCLKSRWITSGIKCLDFENNFSKITGAKYAISLSSATAGLHILLKALGIKKGDEIITPSITFASTINMIYHSGATPIFVDIHYDTLNIDEQEIGKNITKRTKAIILVHFAGAPANINPIIKIAQKHKINIIEDAAHAIGTHYKGKHIGSFGYPAIFSFHPLKNITCGEGGMITINNKKLFHKIKLLRFHGIEREAWQRYAKGINPSYDIKTPGFKYNLTDIQAALGLAQLKKLKKFNNKRKSLAKLYLKLLQGLPEIDLPGTPCYEHEHSWHLFIIKLKNIDRNYFINELFRYNIGCGIHFPPAHTLTYVKKYFKCKNKLPNTEKVANKIVSLPLYPDMRLKDVNYICKAIKEILKNA